MEPVVVIPVWTEPASIPELALEEIGGVSLIARAIRAAAASRAARVIVATQTDRVAQASRAEGAEVLPIALGPWEPAVRPLLGAAATILMARAERPEVLVALDSAFPFVTSDDVDGTIEALAPDAAVAMAAVRACGALWTDDGSGALAPLVRSDSECAPRVVAEVGSVYAVRTAAIAQGRLGNSGKTTCHVVGQTAALAVRSQVDLGRARRIAHQCGAVLPRHSVIYVDVDETVCITPPDRDYRRSVPIPENIEQINRLYDRGHTIVYWTARGGRSGIDHAELTRSQLTAWGARYHRLEMNKPSYDLMICDKARCCIPVDLGEKPLSEAAHSAEEGKTRRTP